MSQQTSSYESFDWLNHQAAINSGGQSPVREPSRFSSAMNSINSFLTTATNTIVTVDGVINKPNSGGDNQNQVGPGELYPGQNLATNAGIPPALKYLAVAGVAVGGSVLAYRGLKK